MRQLALPFLAVFAALVALDAIWLGLTATRLYDQGIGHLMAASPRYGVAVLFYLLYAAGIMAFVVRQEPHATRAVTAGRGALFGFMAYMTYDLTNLATLRGWPVGLSVVDVAWGCLATAIAAATGRIVAERAG
ncbi:MAG: DUF2177 family protein [Burkholderiaceae bacterium]